MTGQSEMSETNRANNKVRSAFGNRAVVALLLFALVNILLSGMVGSENAPKLTLEALRKSRFELRQEGPWCFWAARNYLEQQQNPAIVLFGSSQMGSAAFAADAYTTKSIRDCVTDRRLVTLEKDITRVTGARPEVINFAMPGGMVSDTYLASKALFTAERKPNVVIIGVNPRDFMDNDMPSVSSTDPFRFFSPYVDLGTLADHSFNDPFAKFDWLINKWVPLKKMRQDLVAAMSEWQFGKSGRLEHNTAGPDTANAAIAKEAGGTACGDESNAGAAKTANVAQTQALRAISGAFSDVRKGTWLVPYPLVLGFQDNTKEYQSRYKRPDPPLYRDEKKYFEELLAYLHSLNIKVLVVGMPSLWTNRVLLPDTFWPEFHKYVAAVSGQYGATFLDLTADGRFGVDDYLDTVHLNGSGGLKLFSTIAERIGESPVLAEAVRRGHEGDVEQRGPALVEKHGERTQ